MSTPFQIYLGSDNLLTLTGLKDVATDTFIDDSGGETVTAIITDTDGAQLGSGITLSYVAASNGNWRGTIEEDHTGLVEDQEVRVVVTATATGDLIGKWDMPAKVVKRSGRE